ILLATQDQPEPCGDLGPVDDALGRESQIAGERPVGPDDETEQPDDDVDTDERLGDDVAALAYGATEDRLALSHGLVALSDAFRAMKAHRCRRHAVRADVALAPRTADVGLAPCMAVAGRDGSASAGRPIGRARRSGHDSVGPRL